jgi:prevent-host-death family protein
VDVIWVLVEQESQIGRGRMRRLDRQEHAVRFRRFGCTRLAENNYSNYNTCWSYRMADKVSTMDVRARIGDMLNRVALRHDEFIIERKGKPLAALVPVERLEQMRRFARRHALEFMDQQQPSALTNAQASELGADAKRWARSKPRRRAK